MANEVSGELVPPVPVGTRTLANLRRSWAWWFVGLATLGAFLLFRDYGTGWDTMPNAVYGDRVLDYFLSGFKNPASVGSDIGLAAYYGTLFDLPSAIVHRVLGLDPLALRGLLSALWAVATLPAVIGLGRRLGGERLAFFAAVALILTPAFFGHAFINHKDIPLACAVSWAVLAICDLAASEGEGWRRIPAVGVTFGIALGVRVGAAFLFVFLGAALLARLGQRLATRRQRELSADPIPWRPIIIRAVVGLLVMWIIMVAAWPYALQSPILNPYRAFRAALNFPAAYPVLFEGEVIPSDRLPASYLPVYFALGFPSALLALTALGTGAALATLVRRWREPAALNVFVVLFWIGFPLTYVAVMRPNIYDATRHFLFVLPAFALLAGWGMAGVVAWIEPRLGRAFAWSMAALLLGSAAVPLVRWHPYQYAYLNAFAGDRATLHTRFETDYWVTSYKAAAEWLNRRQQESARPLHVLVAANQFSAASLQHYLDPRIETAGMMAVADHQPLPAEYDYYVGTVRYGMDRNFPSDSVVWEERRDGVLLCVIRAAKR